MIELEENSRKLEILKTKIRDLGESLLHRQCKKRA